MTKGAMLPILIRFTIPLILGNLLQLTYNAIDGIVVGRYVGKEALAAVGTGNPLATLMILFLQGICLGAGILVGTLYGAKDYETLKRQISTAMIAGIAFSLMLTVAVLAAAPFTGRYRDSRGSGTVSQNYHVRSCLQFHL